MSRLFPNALLIPALGLGWLLAGAPPPAAQPAGDLPPGLASARLLPGWTDASGNRVSALELRLLPGWKTYWRVPGDSGLPPSFDWSGSDNLARVTYHWPAPEAIRSGGEVTMGYHDRLILPLTAEPRDPARPVALHAALEFGLCERICVPAFLELAAPDPGKAPDPAIEAAMADVPRPVADQPVCRLEDLPDGVQVEMLLPVSDAKAVALELDDRPEIWVSGTDLRRDGDAQRATADFVPPEAAPFALDTDRLRLTVITPGGAVEMRGCAPEG